MRSNNKHTVEKLEKYIQLFLKEDVSFQELKNNYGLLLSQSAFRWKVLIFQEHDFEGIPGSGLARKYNIPSQVL